MSTKATVAFTNGCHIYHDCIGSNGKESFCVEVDYGYMQDSNLIEVEVGSEFHNLMIYLLEGKTADELIRASKGDFKQMESK